MGKILLCCMVCIMMLFAGCKKRIMEYPYAENNTSVINYFGTSVSDEYQWLEMDPSKNLLVSKWLNAQNNLSDDFFEGHTPVVYDRLQELTAFPRFTFIRSATDTLYYAGIYPYSNKIDIYKYTDGQNLLLKSLRLPFDLENTLNALVLDKGDYMAIVSKNPGQQTNMYFFSLRDTVSAPVHIIKDVVNYRLIPKDQNSFFFVRDAFVTENAVLGVNAVFVCNYSSGKEGLSISQTEFYTDPKGAADDVFDMSYDYINHKLYIGKNKMTDKNSFEITGKIDPDKPAETIFTLENGSGSQFHLAGADDVNLYLISVDKTLKGTLYALNTRTMQLDTIMCNPTMDVRYFSLIKDHVLISFKNEVDNKIYLINKHTLTIQELPAKANVYYLFNNNKRSDKIFYQHESLTSPKEIFMIDSVDIRKRHKVNDDCHLPFSPANYEIENVSYISSTGDEVNLQLTYKKGMVRDGSNPLVILTYLNAEESDLDKFSLVRILYMDFGFIFVQRAISDSRKKLNIRNRVDDIYSSYQYLIKEKYTSPGKVAFIGRQFGASALLDMFNRHNLNTPAVLVDGVYDFVDYNSHGRLLFHNNKVFKAQDSISFRKIYNVSPYHQVKAHKSYPPLLFMVSDKKDLIPEDQTYRLAAKLQMRTKADNPVLLLTPRYVENLEGYDRYTYKMFIEYGMLFIMDQLGLDVEQAVNK